MEEQIKLLNSVLNTMDTITLNGLENIDRLLGCANAIKRVISDLEKAKEV